MKAQFFPELPSGTDWHSRSPVRSVTAYISTYGLMILAAFVSEAFLTWHFLPIVWWFIAARQHSLYTLNHEASHGNLFASSLWNKRIATWLSVFPFFHHPEAFSFVLWKRAHVLHHGFLFTADDPNYMGRKARGDTESKVSFSRLVWNLLTAPVESIKGFFFGAQDYVGPAERGGWSGRKISHLGLLIFPVKEDPELEQERKVKIGFMVFLITALYFLSLLHLFVLYWIIPMYTFYPSILRLMDLTEHNWEADPRAGLELKANSRRIGILQKIFLSDSNRHLHWEHHLWPRVPSFRLPGLAREIRSSESRAFKAGFFSN